MTDYNLGDPTSTVFCDAMHPGKCRHCKNDCVSGTTQKTKIFFFFNVNIEQIGIFYHQQWLDIHLNSGGFPL